MTPADHVVLTVWHWIAGFVITGGGGAALLTWWLSRKKKRMASDDHPHQVLHKKIDAHILEDNARFEQANNMLEKSYGLLIDMKEDMGKVKGKLNIV